MDKYDITQNGFLPIICVNKIPEKYKFIDNIISNINNSNIFEFRRICDNLPKYNNNYDIKNITDEEKRYMYSILSMTINKYIWGNGVDDAVNRKEIPDIIAILFYELSKDIGIVPILTHAAVDLWNWEKEGEEWTLDNIRSMCIYSTMRFCRPG